MAVSSHSAMSRQMLYVVENWIQKQRSRTISESDNNLAQIDYYVSTHQDYGESRTKIFLMQIGGVYKIGTLFSVHQSQLVQRTVWVSFHCIINVERVEQVVNMRSLLGVTLTLTLLLVGRSTQDDGQYDNSPYPYWGSSSHGVQPETSDTYWETPYGFQEKISDHNSLERVLYNLGIKDKPAALLISLTGVSIHYIY